MHKRHGKLNFSEPDCIGAVPSGQGCSQVARRQAASMFLLLQFMMLLAAAQAMAAGESGKIIAVGPQNPIQTLAEASKLAKDGDVVEVEAGDYMRDVAVWTQDNLTIRAKNGRARLLAKGKSVEGKGIWVVRGGAISVSGFDFVGAAVNGRNGAGIRFEKGKLLIDDCRFLENENGILTGGHADSTLEIRNSEFAFNGFGDGQSHNLYVGAISQLKVSGSYFHHAKVGHLLKSRARENHIIYNRLTDETGGTASYELEFPNGGLAYVMGNIIQQSSTTENPHLISFGAEGYKGTENNLHLVFNTLIDSRPKGGIFLRIAPGGRVMAANNILLGDGTLKTSAQESVKNNFNVDFDEFVLAVREDYRLKPDSRLNGKAIKLEALPGFIPQPTAQYHHPRSVRPVSRQSLNPGALQ